MGNPAEAEQSAGGQGASPSSMAAGEGGSAGFHNTDLGNGWQPVGSLPLERATQFTVDYFADGYKLLCLADGARYLLVPEGADVPAGLADDIVALRQPIGDVYLAASDTLCLFEALGALDAITVSGIAKENWSIDAAVEAMEQGSIAYGGKYSMPDYDMLLASGVRLAIESTMINHTPAVRDKLLELGIPVFTERSSYEPDPLGRTEWVKLYGAMLDKDDQAAELFKAQAEQVREVVADGAGTGKTVAYFYLNSNGAAVVRKPGDYVSRMIELAGGSYVFEPLADDESGATVTLEMERFYAEAKDADVIVYNATIDAGVGSLSDLAAKNSLLGDFKAVRDGEVWVTKQDMYQHMMDTGQIIDDFHQMLAGSDAELTYLRRLG